ncbi:IS200/IS605 family transposase [Longimicrobium sp.]|uniref:IS200/IS605 family transposase n=1 Tax=Longimicrobium sp. TaxID=2029185 RepID=UPI002CCDE2D8|nr:IS200/IS605 family transposase [Longimicrobium sp.]HSU14971.1 IS200/IS605 family transposase [Longimicrobium sp.]
MRAPYTQLYLHLVWATWDRHPFLVRGIRERVYECIQAECVAPRADVVAMGGMEDHVHLLVRVSPAIAPADLVKRVKGASSHMVNHEIRPPFYFKWQGAYGAFSVSKRHVPLIREYVLRQEEHHRDRTLYPLLEPPAAPAAEPKLNGAR